MARYILIDNGSGYIYGDTADLEGWSESEQTPEIAAELVNRHEVKEQAANYEFTTGRVSDGRTGYHVYRADVRGSDQVAVVQDGQDQEVIDAVTKDCDYVGFVSFDREYDA